MSFTYDDSVNIEFGVCRGPFNAGDASLIPVDNDVKMLLHDMVVKTRATMSLDAAPNIALPLFEPSERYDSESRVALPLEDGLALRLRSFYNLANILTDAEALAEPQEISVYFCIIYDRDDNKLVALRRASQFKAVLKTHLLRFIDNGLHAVKDTVFKLDTDFELFIADDMLYIKNVAAFEQMADIDEEVRTAAVQNIRELERMTPTIGFITLADYVTSHKRAARVIAALHRRDDLQQTSPTNLRRECRKAGVDVQMVNGKMVPAPGSEMGFLNVLDRRRYGVSLIAGRWERYEASSRKGVGVSERQEAE
jgi:hypothetical protein